MKVAIVGSRNYEDYKTFKVMMDVISKSVKIDMIVSGGAKGIDSLAYRYAVEKGITFVCHPPIPSEGFPRAYFRRNLRIVEMAEMVIAFPMGISTGTRHSISLAKRLNKELKVIELKS